MTPAPNAPPGAHTLSDINEAAFDEVVLRSSVPTLVDFYGKTCGPCRMLAPFLEVAAREYAGRMRVVKIDTEAFPAVAERFEVRALPTLVLFKQGQVVARRAGFSSSPRQLIGNLVGPHLPA